MAPESEAATLDITDTTQAADANADATSRVMVLLTLEQRAALLEYLAKQPYQDVANGIDFLRNALTINVTFASGDETKTDAADD